MGVASRNCLTSAADKLEFIKGVSIDTTCCSVVALDKNYKYVNIFSLLIIYTLSASH